MADIFSSSSLIRAEWRSLPKPRPTAKLSAWKILQQGFARDTTQGWKVGKGRCVVGGDRGGEARQLAQRMQNKTSSAKDKRRQKEICREERSTFPLVIIIIMNPFSDPKLAKTIDKLGPPSVQPFQTYLKFESPAEHIGKESH